MKGVSGCSNADHGRVKPHPLGELPSGFDPLTRSAERPTTEVELLNPQASQDGEVPKPFSAPLRENAGS